MARTDVGGSFRYLPATDRWTPTLFTEDVDDPGPADYRVESLAVAPTDADRWYVAGGDSLTEARGRVLVSADGG